MISRWSEEGRLVTVYGRWHASHRRIGKTHVGNPHYMVIALIRARREVRSLDHKFLRQHPHAQPAIGMAKI